MESTMFRMIPLCLFFLLLLCPAPSGALPKSSADLAAITNNLLETSVGYGAIPSLYRPRYDRVMEADLSMEREDPVFIVMFPSGPRIYPQRIMVWHLVVNEVINDTAYAVTYCPITGTLAAYDTSMQGLNLILDPEGRLYQGNAVLIDRNSGSLWLQQLGMAFEGPLMGRGLPLVPVYWTTWGAAKRAFPQALVLGIPTGSRRPYSRDPYGNYLKKGTYYDNDQLVYRVGRLDKRLHRKTPILGLELNGALVGIDIGYVKKKGAVNFFLGPEPLLAVHDRQLDVVRVFNRHIWQKPSLFAYHQGVLIDLGTRTRWNPATGRALEGNMQGASMKQYFGIYSMWFAWYAVNPETFLIPGPGEVSQELLNTTPLDK